MIAGWTTKNTLNRLDKNLLEMAKQLEESLNKLFRTVNNKNKCRNSKMQISKKKFFRE